MANSVDTSSEPGAVSPATGAPLEPVASTPVDQMAAVVDRARQAHHHWQGLTVDERISAVNLVAERVLERHDEVVELIACETGKDPAEILVNEVSGVVEYAKTAAREARQALAPVDVRLSRLTYPHKSAVIEALPRGVVAIIAPWNYPLSIFFKPLFPALLSGNAVVLKPSEYTPRTAAWLADQCRAVLPVGLVQVVQGAGKVGSALVDSGIDALSFTGSVETGKRLAARCGELFIPCSIEAGGKDAAIVLADCNVDRTCSGIAQWALHNCGQNCAAIERVYVEDAIADRFVERLGHIADAMRITPQAAICDIGPLQTHQQLDTVESHVQDALDKGAVLVCGGQRTGQGLGYRPTVLDRCSETMDIVTEETFGPVIAVIRVADADEAVARSNAAHYGLNGSVWTADIDRGRQIARRLEVGIALVNNHAIVGTMANIPWTGVKDTGGGVAASRFSYHTFTRRRTLFVDTSSKPDPWWFPANEDLRAFGETLVDVSLGSWTSLLKLARIARRRVKAIEKLAAGE